MKERSEDDIVAKSPVDVTLGNASYQIRPLTLIPARKWRALLVKTMNEIVASMSQPEEIGHLGEALTATMIKFPEKLCDLVFSYAPDLDKAKILDEETGATEEQMAAAFSTIMLFAYPFLGQLIQTIQVMKANH